MPKINMTNLNPKAASCLNPVCAWCARGGEGERRWGWGTVISLPRRAVLRSQTCPELHFLWHQPPLYSRRQGWFCFTAHQSPASVLSRPVGQLGHHPASRTSSSNCFEGRCSILKGTFFLPPACGWLGSPEAWELVNIVILTWQGCRSPLNHLKNGSLLKTCLHAFPP